MCVVSVLSFVAQLYALPHSFLAEIEQTALKFMLGPYQWLHGRGGHSYFRSAVDLGLKASTRCVQASTLSLLYVNTTRFHPDFATKIHNLTSATARNTNTLTIKRCIQITEASPAWHSKHVHSIMQSRNALRDMQRSVPMGVVQSSIRLHFQSSASIWIGAQSF